MKLTPTLVEQTVAQFPAVALPESNAVHQKLEEVFGDHTFLLNDNGLHIVEPVTASGGEQMGRIVKIAEWQDSDRSALAAHQPELTDVVIRLAA